MRNLLIILAVVFPLLALADSSTPEELAKSYVAAVQAKNMALLKKLIHPKFLSGLNSDETKYIDAGLQHFLADGDKLKEPMWIRKRELSSKEQADLSVEWRWKVAPEVQIEMQPYRIVDSATKEATDFMAVQFAKKFEGKYFLVFQLPKAP